MTRSANWEEVQKALTVKCPECGAEIDEYCDSEVNATLTILIREIDDIIRVSMNLSAEEKIIRLKALLYDWIVANGLEPWKVKRIETEDGYEMVSESWDVDGTLDYNDFYDDLDWYLKYSEEEKGSLLEEEDILCPNCGSDDIETVSIYAKDIVFHCYNCKEDFMYDSVEEEVIWAMKAGIDNREDWDLEDIKG